MWGGGLRLWSLTLDTPTQPSPSRGRAIGDRAAPPPPAFGGRSMSRSPRPPDRAWQCGALPTCSSPYRGGLFQRPKRHRIAHRPHRRNADTPSLTSAPPSPAPARHRARASRAATSRPAGPARKRVQTGPEHATEGRPARRPSPRGAALVGKKPSPRTTICTSRGSG